MHKCLLDMDGIVVDMIKGAMQVTGVEKVDSNYNGIYDGYLAGTWDLSKTLKLPHSDSLWGMVDADWWANLPWTIEGKAILDLAESHFGRKNVCLLTRPLPLCLGGDECVTGKLRWISRHMPDYSERYLMGAAKQFCAGSTDHLLIDDSDTNTESFTLHGGRAFLVPRPWNTRHKQKHEVLPKLEKFLNSI
jgi:hypothetical protein